MNQHTKLLVATGLMSMLITAASGQIYRWDTGEVIPRTDGITPGPDLTMSVYDLVAADFSGGLDLSRANFSQCDLSLAHFDDANLTDTIFISSNISGAQFDRAIINGARMPGTLTSDQLYSTASYVAGDISGVWLSNNNLENWDLSGQNVTDVWFDNSTGFTAAQLYSTASYQSKNIQGVGLNGIDLTGWDFTDQNVCGVRFDDSLTADQLYSTASYQRQDMNGIYFAGDVTGWDLTDQDITGVTFRKVTTAELYSTASYKARDLWGLGFMATNLSGFDLSNQNLNRSYFAGVMLHDDTNIAGSSFKDAWFSGTTIYTDDLSGMDFSGSTFSGSRISSVNCDSINLHQVNMYSDSSLYGNFQNAIFTDAWLYQVSLTGEFTGADFRGAHLYQSWSSDDAIQPDGHVTVLRLYPGDAVIIRDYDGQIPITIDYLLTMQTELVQGVPSQTSELKILFEDGDWGSTISFADLIQTIDLDGTLALGFADDVTRPDLASLIGTSFQVFDWNGHLPAGMTFREVAWQAGYDWDISDLYIGGTVTLLDAPLAGDCNLDHNLDFSDLAAALPCLLGPEKVLEIDCRCADMDGDMDLDLADLAIFQQGFTGTLP